MRIQWRDRNVDEPDPERIWLIVSVASIAAGVAWFAASLPWPRCPFLSLTGLPCLTCGATRCLIALLHQDFASALRWNPLASFAILFVLAFDLYAAIVLAGRLPRLRITKWSSSEKRITRVIAISLLALNWAYLLAHRGRF